MGATLQPDRTFRVTFMRHSRHHLIGWALIVFGAILTRANLFAVVAGIFLFSGGVFALFWQRRLGRLGVTGKEVCFRLVAISLPFVVLAAVEMAVRLIEEPAIRPGSEDRKATALMGSLGTKRYKGLSLYLPSQRPWFRINDMGFRTYDFDTPRGRETRIMLLGGSTAFGWAVSDDHTIGKYLEDFLSQKTGGDVKVFNLGVPGATFSHEALLLEDFIGQISPNIVLFYHGANDVLAWYSNTIAKSESKEELVPQIFGIKTILHYAFKLRTFQYLFQSVKSILPKPDSERIDVSKTLEDYNQNLSKISKYCESTDCMYVLQPTIFQKPNLIYHEIKQKRIASASMPKYDIVYSRYVNSIMENIYKNHFDARDVFDNSRGLDFLDWIHLSGTGNRLVAQFIANTICAKRLLLCE